MMCVIRFKVSEYIQMRLSDNQSDPTFLLVVYPTFALELTFVP